MNKTLELTRNDLFHLSLIRCVASNSIAVKRKVGAVIGISNDEYYPSIISTGYNRKTLKDPIQECEDKNGKTYDSVVHAEEDAIITALKSWDKNHIENATIYCTYSPCINCCKLIVLSGIKRLVYIDRHKVNFHTFGELNVCCQDFLYDNGVEIIRVDEETKTIIEHIKPPK